MDRLAVLLVAKSSQLRNQYRTIIYDTGMAEIRSACSSAVTAQEKLTCQNYDVLLISDDVEHQHINDTIGACNRDNIKIILLVNEMKKEINILEVDEIIQHESPQKVRNMLIGIFTSFITNKYNSKKKEHPIQVKVNDPQVQKQVSRELPPFSKADIVLIASSTGGPRALSEIISRLTGPIDAPILIVQHMPPVYTSKLASSLNQKTDVEVQEAEDGMTIEKGKIYVAPGGKVMTVHKTTFTNKIRTEQPPSYIGILPSADRLFESVGTTYNGKKILIVILTGMGRDGTEGVKIVKSRSHCYCITQSEQSCVVYGMPKNVVAEGLSDQVCDMEEIAMQIIKRCKR